MIYPQKMNSKKSDFIWKMSIAISILVAFILGIINKITTPKIPWSALVNAGIIYIWITVFYSIKKRVNIAGHVFLQTIAISLLTLAIDYELGMKGWAINIAIPITIPAIINPFFTFVLVFLFINIISCIFFIFYIKN